jgi:hypothetical protein
LDAYNYRPLTVLNSVAGLYTKLLNARLVQVVETHGLLGQIQNGFRKGRSGADSGFILNTVLWKSSALRKKPHLAFLDLQKQSGTIGWYETRLVSGIGLVFQTVCCMVLTSISFMW